MAIPFPSSCVDPLTGYKRTAAQALYHQNVPGSYNTSGQNDAWDTASSLAKRPRFDNAINLPLYPQRPGEEDCAHYMQTRTCKFGDSCMFDHPIWVPEGGIPDWKEGEVDCLFYLKTGSCKYGATCCYNYPDRYAINPPAAAAFVAFLAAHLNIGLIPSASILQSVDPRLTQAVLVLGPTVYPQRPGQIQCDFYMKSGVCMFGESCKYHHPTDQSAHALSEAQQQNTKLTLAGLPRRESAINCPYYMKTGACKYGAACKFDHPTPREVMPTTTEETSTVGVQGGKTAVMA